jgi:hypothetical protein
MNGSASVVEDETKELAVSGPVSLVDRNVIGFSDASKVTNVVS